MNCWSCGEELIWGSDNDLVNTGTFVEIATYIIEENGEFEIKDLDK